MNNVYCSVTTCFNGTIYAGSASYFNQNLTQTTCTIGYTDACVKLFGGSSVAFYGCSSQSLCGSYLSATQTLTNLNNLVVSYQTYAVCCYSNNCNKAVNSISINRLLILGAILFAYILFID
jgi:hypothetical protein